MITSVHVRALSRHRIVSVRWKGQTLGELVTTEDELPELIRWLRPQSVEPEVLEEHDPPPEACTTHGSTKCGEMGRKCQEPSASEVKS